MSTGLYVFHAALGSGPCTICGDIHVRVCVFYATITGVCVCVQYSAYPNTTQACRGCTSAHPVHDDDHHHRSTAPHHQHHAAIAIHALAPPPCCIISPPHPHVQQRHGGMVHILMAHGIAAGGHPHNNPRGHTQHHTPVLCRPHASRVAVLLHCAANSV